MRMIISTVALALLIASFGPGQSPPAGGRGEGRTVILQTAPTDKTVSIPLETLKRYYADMDGKKLSTLRMLEGGRYNVNIRRITNANSSEPVAPCRGRFASISIWVENLPADAGLHHLQVSVGDSFGTVTYIGPPDKAGLQQLNVILPELEATGLLPVEIHWRGRKISPPATLRVIPPGPSVPLIRSIRDGVNLASERRIETRSVKMVLEEIARPHEIEASISGFPVSGFEYLCTDPRPQRFEVNFRLPEEVGPGVHSLVVKIGRRTLPPVSIEVVGN